MDTDTTHGTVRELELTSRWQETLARADKYITLRYIVK